MTAVRCPICRQYVERLIDSFKESGEQAVIRKLQAENPAWRPDKGVCERCLYLNEFATLEEHFDSPTKGTLFRLRVNNEFALLPTPLRLNADPRFDGRGITIAFIDSGFYPHPDLLKPTNRIRAIVDVTDQKRSTRYFNSPHPESWHGTMTSVAAAGNGHVSDGLYRGIASGAEVVLIKVMDTKTKRINSENITRGIQWAIEHREEHRIRIISISVGDDEPLPLEESPVDQAAEEAVKCGMVVVAATGNTPDRSIVPPASAPSVISVGGLDDRNAVHHELRSMYHSTFGKTVNGHMKPEVIAPAIWLAGPILPKTDQYAESAILFRLLTSLPRNAARLLARLKKEGIRVPKNIVRGDYKHWARKRIEEMKYVAPYYKHVDGTSFAAPIVSSVIAQMLEATPLLSPAKVKQILIETAEAIAHAPKDQQGYGVLNPRAAVERALKERLPDNTPGVHAVDGALVFVYHNRVPRKVALAGDFNGWKSTTNYFQEIEPGVWSCWLSKPKAGTYSYKYVIDGAVWLEDPANQRRQPDGFGGWNSRVTVDN